MKNIKKLHIKIWNFQLRLTIRSDKCTASQHGHKELELTGFSSLDKVSVSLPPRCSLSPNECTHPSTWSHLCYLFGPNRNLDHNHFCNDVEKKKKEPGTFSHKTKYIKFVSWHLNFIIVTQIYYHRRVLASVIILAECQKGGLLLLSYLWKLVYIFKKSVSYILSHLLIR